MNDFTKDELLKIHESCIFWFDNGYQGSLDDAKNLNIKIKNLIDSYCEPKSHTTHQSNCIICDDCQKVIG